MPAYRLLKPLSLLMILVRWPKSVYKPDPVRPDLTARPDDHSSRPDVTIGLKQPTRPACSSRSTKAGRFLHNGAGPIWPCSGWGLPSRHVTTPLVRSYRTISPLPTGPLGFAYGNALRPILHRGRYLFCGTSP